MEHYLLLQEQYTVQINYNSSDKSFICGYLIDGWFTWAIYKQFDYLSKQTNYYNILGNKKNYFIINKITIIIKYSKIRQQ